MSKDISVAPKERVNITYKGTSGDQQAEVELPLKLMMIGDYSGMKDERPLEERKPIGVDKDNFNEVLRKQEIAINMVVPNKLSREPGAELAVKVKFENMKDFEPENVVKQVPELNQLLELRNALTALKGPLGNVPAFRRKLESIILDKELRGRLMQELTGSKE